MSKTYSKTRTLVECALMIALGTVLANIKIFEMPNGGSITLLSMLPFILISFRHGVKWGLFTGFVNSLLQMLLGFYAPPAPGLLPLVGMILLDYVLAFTCWAWPAPLPSRLRTAWLVWLSARRWCAASASCAASCPAC